MIRRTCLGGCTSCLVPVLVVVAALGFLYHQVTTAPPYAAVLPSSAAQVRASLVGALAGARRARSDIAAIQLGDAELTRLLRQAAGGSPSFTDLAAHVEPGWVAVTGTVRPAGQRVVLSGRFGLRPAGGGALALQARRMWIGAIGLPGALVHLVASVLPSQLALPLNAAGPLQVVCLAPLRGRLLVAVRVPGLPGGGAPSAAALCAGPGN